MPDTGNASPGAPKTQSAAAGEPSAGHRSPVTRSAKALMATMTFRRSATPYFIAALLAALAMGWYFFIFVPQKLEYFVGLRFRTLAVASGQIKGKAESLGRSMSIAPSDPHTSAERAPSETATAKYLRLLVPDIQVKEDVGLRLVVNGGDRTRALKGTVAWDRVAAQAAAASRSEFDDLVLADANGQAVWQREQTTPRVGSLRELLYSDDDKGTLLSPSWSIRTTFPAVDSKKGLPKTAALKAVRIGASSTFMLVQAVNLESPFITDPNQTTLYVAGFVSRNRLQQQAMRIPLVWLVAVWLPVAILFLALPFIKLATMNAKERFSAMNLVVMAICTVATAALAAVIPLGPRTVSAAGDQALERLAASVDAHLGAETQSVLGLAKEIEKARLGQARLGQCEVQVGADRWKTDALCDLWSVLPIFSRRDAVPELDVAIWLDERGDQILKWTTKAQLTAPAPHAAFAHFQNLRSGTLWSLRATPDNEEPLANVRAAVAVPRTMPASVVASSTTLQPTADSDARYLALNIRPHAVIDPVMPPGYGFAIVAPEGKVLFHSIEGLSLEENFFAEVSNVQSVRDRMQVDRSVTWSGDYHGIPHRIHLQRLASIPGSHWKIVTFQDLTPGLAAVVAHQSGTFRLMLLAILLLLLLLAAFTWTYTKSRGRELRDLMVIPCVPDSNRLWWFTALGVPAALLLGATTRPSAPAWCDLLCAFFVALPLLAVGISIHARWHGPMPERRRSTVAAVAELVALIVLVGVIPAAGFAQIVRLVQEMQSTERWLELAYQQTVAQAERSRSRVVGRDYADATRAQLTVRRTFAGGAQEDALHFYLPASSIWTHSGSDPCTARSDDGQRAVRAFLDWRIFPTDRKGPTSVRACAASNRLQLGAGAASIAAVAGGAGDTVAVAGDWQRWVLGFLLFLGTVGAAIWAWLRLDTAKPPRAATLEEVLPLLDPKKNQGIMLVGAPRTGKDWRVKTAVLNHAKLPEQVDGSPSIYPIELLDRTIDDAFLKATRKALAARAKQPQLLDADQRLWIHVSNLETQLITAARRKAVLTLLEQLLNASQREPLRVVVVTTSVDPIAHFNEIFTEERSDTYGDQSPEVELSRSAHVLSRLRRCYLPLNACRTADPWWDYDPQTWTTTVAWEAGQYPPLADVKSVLGSAYNDRPGEPHPVSRNELAQTFEGEAVAAYDLLWASCTRCEKLVLVQLAQEGYVTTQNREVVCSLINKGLIVDRPTGPAIFNHTFRLFLRHIERDHIVAAWEQEDGSGIWRVAVRLIGSSLIAGGLFYLTTQDFSVDSLVPVVSGTGLFGAPMLRALLARMTTRAAVAAA
jgi:hypothetical protein